MHVCVCGYVCRKSEILRSVPGRVCVCVVHPDVISQRNLESKKRNASAQQTPWFCFRILKERHELIIAIEEQRSVMSLSVLHRVYIYQSFHTLCKAVKKKKKTLAWTLAWSSAAPAPTAIIMRCVYFLHGVTLKTDHLPLHITLAWCQNTFRT